MARRWSLHSSWRCAARTRRRRRARRQDAPDVPTIVALGDSITAGEPASAWPDLLAVHLHTVYPGSPWRVLNAGAPGDTAPLGCARFAQDVAPAGPQIVLIAFGLNDCYPGRYGMDRWWDREIPRGLARSHFWRAAAVRLARLGRRLGMTGAHLPEDAPVPTPRASPEGFSAALRALVEHTRALDSQPVLLTMTPLAEADTEAVRLRRPTYPRYNERIRRAAHTLRTPLVELAAGAPDDSFLPDGLHLTESGQAWVAEQVFRQLDVHGIWHAIAEAHTGESRR